MILRVQNFVNKRKNNKLYENTHQKKALEMTLAFIIGLGSCFSLESVESILTKLCNGVRCLPLYVVVS